MASFTPASRCGGVWCRARKESARAPVMPLREGEAGAAKGGMGSSRRDHAPSSSRLRTACRGTSVPVRVGQLRPPSPHRRATGSRYRCVPAAAAATARARSRPPRQIDGVEYSFGWCDEGTGVYSCTPAESPGYHYRATVEMGHTTLARSQARPSRRPTHAAVYI